MYLTVYHRLLYARLRSIVLAVTTVILVACTSSPRLTVLQGQKMGTSFQVKIVSSHLSDQRIFELHLAVEGVFDAIDRKMSTYRDDSEVSRFNKLRNDEPLLVSSETFEVFRHAREISEETDGAFDITVGPLVDAWGFGAGGVTSRGSEKSLPTENEIDAIRPHLGWQLIDLDEEEITLSKRNSSVRCDLSAIAKGYAVDRVADTLNSMGIEDYLVELGGEVRTSGSNEEGASWRIAIERPQSVTRQLHRLLPLRNLALATSGDYRNFYEKDGLRYSHTIDPRTGRPVRDRLASVSVLDTLCVRADAYATALMVLGEVEGFRFAVDNNLMAIFLIREKSGVLIEKTTPMFDEKFEAR